MIKNEPNLLIYLIIFTLISCVQSNNNYSKTRTQISEYTKQVQDFKIDTGIVQFDTIPKNMTTHQLDSGSNIVFVYERTGVTFIDLSDEEVKYTETLIFQINSAADKFEFCDTSLKQIECKYYWICLAREIKKEIIDIKKGCIKGLISPDSIMIDIDINSGFGFGGLMDKDNDRVIKYKTTRR